MEGHTSGGSVVILVRVSRLILFVPVVHSIVVVPINAIIHDEIVLGKTSFDDALVLFLGHLVVKVRVFLLDPRSATTLACTFELREPIDFGLFFASGAVSHSCRWSRLGEGYGSACHCPAQSVDVGEGVTCHVSVTLRGRGWWDSSGLLLPSVRYQ